MSEQTHYSYFIKGDISGIQDFIFNVKSEKAARVLKARSFYVELIADFAANYIERLLGKSNVSLFFNGGGNFYLYVKTDDIGKLDELQSQMNEFTYQNDFFLILSWVENEGDFSSIWKAVNKKSSLDKQQLFSGKDYDIFEPYENPVERRTEGKAKNIWELDVTQRFALHFPKMVALSSREPNKIGKFTEGVKSLTFLNQQFQLTVGDQLKRVNEFPERIPQLLPTLKGFNRDDKSEDSILDKYKEKLEEIHPKEESDKLKTSNVTEFELLSHFAFERTGTEKLGILKMDVDDLGNLFSNIEDNGKGKELSQNLKYFFDEKLVDFLNDPLPDHLQPKNYKQEGRAYKFGDNIYTIFAGGDDCFFVGAWDAILEWAWKIKDAFADHTEHYKIKQKDGKLATLSAGVCIVHSKYPVVRFAEIAEDALKDAKGADGKNAISIFDQVLSWEEFEDGKQHAYQLVAAIEKDRDVRALLSKIRSNAKAFEIQHEQAVNGKISLPKVWRLFYIGRDHFNKDNPPELQDKAFQSPTLENATRSLINNYYLSLMKAFTNKGRVNPMKYPVIARWTELLTRKSKKA